MSDNADSDSEVELPVASRKRKYVHVNDTLEDDENESYEDDEDSDSEGEDEEDESDNEDSGDNEDDAVNDADLADDVNNDQCSICLMEFTDQLVGMPNSCTHVFCSVCILEWSKNINTCPVDRKVFYTVAIRRTKDGPVLEQINVEDRTKAKDEYEDPTVCEICGVGDREDRMLLCDECDRGFHLECLTPPLDSVPLDEWFCPDCALANPPRESEEESQFADSEISSFYQEPETSSAIVQDTSRRRTSMSGRGRARTVATTRRRRRAQAQSSSGHTQRRSRRGKSTNKQKSSSRGASTSTTGGKRKSKKKRRRRKRRRRAQQKGNDQEKDIRRRRWNDVSVSKYMLPHEMEPSATFSLFGSDFDLECLPVVEARTTIAPPEAEDENLSASSNPDVLGSIFTGLNTLYHKDLSVDTKGRVKVPEDVKDTKSESCTIVSSPSNEQECSSVSNVSKTIDKDTKLNFASITCDASGPNLEMQDTGDREGIAKCEKRDTTCEVNKKRIQYFENRTDKYGPKTPKTFNSIFGTRSSTSKTSCESTSKDPGAAESAKKPQTSKSNFKGRVMKSPKRSPGLNSLASYKIPRKKTNSNLSVEALNDIKSIAVPERLSKGKIPTGKSGQTLGDKGARYSSSDFGILPRLTEKSCKEWLGKKYICTDREGASYPKNRNFTGNRSYVGASSQGSTTSVVSVGQTHDCSSGTSCTTKDSVSSVNNRSHRMVSMFVGGGNRTPFSVEDNTKQSTSSFGQNSTSSVKLNPFKNRDLCFPRSDNNGKWKKTLPYKLKPKDNSSATFTKVIPERPSAVTSKVSSSSDKDQTTTNLHLIDMLKRRKTNLFVSSDGNRVDGDSTGCGMSSGQSTASDKPSGISSLVTRDSVQALPQERILPPLRPAAKPARPIAVVHPTKQGATGTRENSSDVDIHTQKRREGIERLRRKQEIQDEVKEALAGFYRHKEITKEQYKYIFKRAVAKIQESRARVESCGVMALVKNYVKKCKGQQLNLKDQL